MGLTLSPALQDVNTEEVARMCNIPGPRLARDVFHLRCMLGGIDLAGRRVLEIGCGSGVYILLAALGGAAEAVGLEPEAAGSGSGVFQEAESRAKALELSNIRLLPLRMDEYLSGSPGKFDIVLAHNVVNHIDEEAVQVLHKDPQARKRYCGVFENIWENLAAGGCLIIADCGRHNLFSGTSRLGVFRGVFNRSIEWNKHQGPRLWAKLLRSAGFSRTEKDYFVPWSMRKVSMLANNPLFAYLTLSHFTIRVFA